MIERGVLDYSDVWSHGRLLQRRDSGHSAERRVEYVLHHAVVGHLRLDHGALHGVSGVVHEIMPVRLADGAHEVSVVATSLYIAVHNLLRTLHQVIVVTATPLEVH